MDALDEAGGGSWMLGSFVQANFGIRSELTVLGVPLGRHLKGGEVRSTPVGSVIAVTARPPGSWRTAGPA